MRVPVIVRVGPRLRQLPGVAAGSTGEVAVPMAVALLLPLLLAILPPPLRAWGARRSAPPSPPPRLGWCRSCAAAHVQPECGEGAHGHQLVWVRVRARVKVRVRVRSGVHNDLVLQAR